jgi:hypothetical protein
LKRDTGKLTGQLSYGGNLTPTANDHTGDFDGQNIQVDLNYGNKIGRKADFITLHGHPSSEILPTEREQKAETFSMPIMRSNSVL